MPIQEICVLSPTHIVDPGLSSLCIMFSCQNLVDHLRLDFIFSHLSFSVYPSFSFPISFSPQKMKRWTSYRSRPRTRRFNHFCSLPTNSWLFQCYSRIVESSGLITRVQILVGNSFDTPGGTLALIFKELAAIFDMGTTGCRPLRGHILHIWRLSDHVYWF